MPGAGLEGILFSEFKLGFKWEFRKILVKAT